MSTTQRLSGSRSSNIASGGRESTGKPSMAPALVWGRRPLSFRRSLRRPRFLVEEVGAFKYQGPGEMLGAQ